MSYFIGLIAILPVLLLAAKKPYLASWVGLCNQPIWAAWAINAHQPGVLISCAFFSALYIKSIFTYRHVKIVEEA